MTVRNANKDDGMKNEQNDTQNGISEALPSENAAYSSETAVESGKKSLNDSGDSSAGGTTCDSDVNTTGENEASLSESASTGSVPESGQPRTGKHSVKAASGSEKLPPALSGLGARIKRARIAAHMNQSELAGGSVTRNMISRIETGDALPSLTTLCVIAERLGVPAGVLLGDPDDYRQYRTARELHALLSKKRYSQIRERASDYIAGDKKIFDPYMSDVLSEYCAEISDELFGEGRLAEAKRLALRAVELSNNAGTDSALHAELTLDLIDRMERNAGRASDELPERAAERSGKLRDAIFGRNRTAVYLFARDILDEPAAQVRSVPTDDAEEIIARITPLTDGLDDGFYRQHILAKFDMLRSDYLGAKARLVRIDEGAEKLPPSLGFDILTDLEQCCKCCGDFENAYKYSARKLTLLQKIRL